METLEDKRRRAIGIAKAQAAIRKRSLHELMPGRFYAAARILVSRMTAPDALIRKTDELVYRDHNN